MKKKDLNDIRKKSIKQLKKDLDEKKEELKKINIDLSLGQESNVKKAKLARKDIAQIMTIIREKEIVEEQKVNSTDNKNKNGKEKSA